MAEYPAFPLWTDAYLADTTHLTTIEHGAYLLLLMAMWRAGGSLPNDDRRLARFAKMGDGQWARIKATMMEFFTVEDDRLTQGRLTDEMTFVRQRSAAQSNNARAKSRKTNTSHAAVAQPNSSQTAAPTPTPTPTPTPSQPQIFDQLENPVGAVSTKRAPSDRGTSLPRDWTLPRSWKEWALVEFPFLAEEIVDRFAVEFRDYWIGVPGQRGRKKDWEATWRNRVRDQCARMRPRTGTERAPTALERRAAKLRERIQNEHGIGREGGGDHGNDGGLPLLIEDHR